MTPEKPYTTCMSLFTIIPILVVSSLWKVAVEATLKAWHHIVNREALEDGDARER